jgi:DNA repair protein RecN (Recombination protein N)
VISHLRIKNLALLESVTLQLPRDFIAITGETGAGKSVLVGALRLLAGARADKNVVREGADATEVEASINFADSKSLNAVNELLSNSGLPPCEGKELLLFRSISISKPAKIVINGQLASLNTLQQLGALWLEYNSPEAVLELYTPAQQLLLLDRYGNIHLTTYLATFEKYRAAKERLDKAKNSERLNADELAFLEKQIEKIDNLRLSAESIDNLEREYKRLAGLEEEMAATSQIIGAFGDVRRLQMVVSRARALSAQNPSYQPLVDRLESLIIELDDQESSWRSFSSKSEMTLSERELIEERMRAWMELKRRYQTLEGVMNHREELADKLQLQLNLDVLLEQYEKECQTALAAVTLEQQKLLRLRRSSGQKLVDETLTVLRKLGLPKSELEGRFEPTEPNATGGCDFQLYFNANPGQSLKPLTQIASSGELARVMLSLKTVLVKESSKAVVVFDEVDANVGGEVASSVAELLSKLGKTQQVFCITHLPQVAAKANFHLVVRKSSEKNSTSVMIETISDTRKRLEELARMLGDRNAETALQHAKVLLGR